MSFINAVYQVLEEERSSNYPEVETIIKHSVTGVKKGCFILLDPEDEEYISSGNKWQCISQQMNIVLLKHIDKSSSYPDMIDSTKNIAKKVIGILKKNKRLVSSSFPEGFLINSKILRNENRLTVYQNRDYTYQKIVLIGKYMRRLQ